MIKVASLCRLCSRQVFPGMRTQNQCLQVKTFPFFLEVWKPGRTGTEQKITVNSAT